MTPNERAEKIAKWYGNKPSRSMILNIAAEIRQAVEEGQKAAYETMIADCHRHVAEAYEDAAKIVEGFSILNPKWAADAIRARAGETK